MNSNERIKYACEHIIINDKVIESNKTLWNVYKDKLLKEIVVMMNFDFAKIAERFDKICKTEKKIVNGEEQETVYNENELRRHFGFLYAMSVLGKEVNTDYYDSLRKDNNKEKEEMLQIK